jgi:hypothetical protein
MTKTEIIDFLDNKETYNKVLSIIEGECTNNGTTHLLDYDIDDFICGGSIANTLYFLLDPQNRGLIINDVDIFLLKNKFNYLLSSQPFDTFVDSFTSNGASVDSYGRAYYGGNGEYLNMLTTNREGIINTIEIGVFYHKKSFNFNKLNYYQTLLDGFDLNCVKVGLDRVNKKIMYTEDFVDFLLTNKIRVSDVSTPIQTLYRIDKKVKELNLSTSNLESEYSLLQHSTLTQHSLRIGRKTIEKILKNKDLIQKYFKSIAWVDSQGSVLEYGPTPFLVNGLINQIEINTPKELLNFWRIFVNNDFVSNRGVLLEYFKSIGIDPEFSGYMSNSEVKPEKVVCGLVNCVGMSPNYFDCDFSVEDLGVVDNFIKFLTDNGIDPRIFIVKNVEQQLKFIDYFNDKLVDKTGLINRIVMNKIILKSVFEDSVNFNDMDVNKKIKSINKLLNNLWIKVRVGINHYMRF